MPTTAFRARYVFPVDGTPIRDGCVRVQGARIVNVGQPSASDEVHDFGNAAILPGLVNAHTHLELSDVPAPLGRGGMPLPDWIREVIGFRLKTGRAADAVQQGLREVVRAGTTLLGEIYQPGCKEWPFLDEPLDTVVFLELLGLAPELAKARLTAARGHLSLPNVTTGLSPHAPYTVSLELFRGAIAIAQEQGAPLAFHLAESREELEFLRTGGGAFRTLLEERGAWFEDAIPSKVGPLDYLGELVQAPRALVIHGNYLNRAEIDLLARHADRMSVVYCPRTHAWFGHEEHPWRQMLAAGVNVALGTDSRASNPDLSVLEELRFLARLERTIEPRELLRLATLNGAKALGLATEMANLTIVPLLDREASDPYELLFDSSLPPVATVWRGQLYPAAASSSIALRTPE